MSIEKTTIRAKDLEAKLRNLGWDITIQPEFIPVSNPNTPPIEIPILPLHRMAQARYQFNEQWKAITGGDIEDSEGSTAKAVDDSMFSLFNRYMASVCRIPSEIQHNNEWIDNIVFLYNELTNPSNRVLIITETMKSMKRFIDIIQEKGWIHADVDLQMPKSQADRQTNISDG